MSEKTISDKTVNIVIAVVVLAIVAIGLFFLIYPQIKDRINELFPDFFQEELEDVEEDKSIKLLYPGDMFFYLGGKDKADIYVRYGNDFNFLGIDQSKPAFWMWSNEDLKISENKFNWQKIGENLIFFKNLNDNNKKFLRDLAVSKTPEDGLDIIINRAINEDINLFVHFSDISKDIFYGRGDKRLSNSKLIIDELNKIARGIRKEKELQ